MDAPAALVEALADRYRLDRQLGAGGMATVYLAHDHKHDREVAIKVLRPDLAETLGRERFLREIQLAARLNHPNILPLYDSGEASGCMYFVMPVMAGQTLRDRLSSGSPLPVDEAVRIAMEVADALDYAHRRDIVHRDIKPENILLHEGHAVVADFGIGKALVAASAATGVMFTQIGVTVGTPAYMSPEQAAGGDLDGRSDLFALGCVMFEMLTGEFAFSGSSAHAVIARRFAYSPPPITDSRPEIPAAVGETVSRLLQRSADDRFASGAQVVAALRAQSTPPVATAAVAPDRARRDSSIAVLPFTNLSADPDNEYFSDGLTEELITDLSGVKALHVISRTSSLQLKGTTKGMREIGRTLGVRYALTGSARKAGNALRITAQLVDTTTDEQIWAEKYSGTMDDVFDVQERVSRAIVTALRVTLSASEDGRLSERPIKNPRAFELYLRAQVLVRRYGASMDQVNALLDRAIEIEGPSPPLRALRAYLWVTQVRAGMSTDAIHLARAEAEARALMDVAPNAPYGYSLLGIISYERGALADTVRYLTKALELDGSDADALFFRGIALEAAGQGEAAIAAGRRFLDVDPLAPMAGALLNSAHWFVGRPQEGLDAHEHGLVLDPENPIIHWSVGYTYALLGRAADARVQAQWMQAHVPQMPYTVQLVALLEGMAGRTADARAALATLADMSFDGHITFHLSESFAVAGDIPTALRLLEQAVERGFYPYDYIAAHCPFLAPLRGIGDFNRIVARAGERVAEFRREV
ncbi:MAG TPA: protein kinase [Vicinamibacterales bacterium]|nr:protein kinase [Vicinamibacterales bacterium]